MQIVMEETKSLVLLANKMAAVLASNVGPVGEEIVSILDEAQKLMGLAREERDASEQRGEGSPQAEAQWSEIVEQQTASLMKEQRSEEKMSRMAKQLSETEDSYMKAMAESQKTLATAAVERDALLQLASKLEEQTRLQSERESGVLDLLNQKSHELLEVSTELASARERENKLQEERDQLLELVQRQKLSLMEAEKKPEAAQAPSPEPKTPTTNITRQSSWPNPLKWLMHRNRSGSDSEAEDEEEDEELDPAEPETDFESENSSLKGSEPSSPHSTNQVFSDAQTPKNAYYEAQQLPSSSHVTPEISEQDFEEAISGTDDQRAARLFASDNPTQPLLVVM